MLHTSLIPWLDPRFLIDPSAGIWAVVIVSLIIFAETGLLVGFIFPGDTLLFFAGLLTYSGVLNVPIWITALSISFAAWLGGEAGYLIGHKLGPRVFERKESGLFSVKNVHRTNAFFARFGPLAVILARFVPVVRTFAPVAAGVGHMSYRKYSLYNAIGAAIWGGGVVMAGYLLAHIPPVKHFAEHYIDLVLLGVVVISVIPAGIHYLRSVLAARKSASESENDADVADTAIDRSGDRGLVTQPDGPDRNDSASPSA